MCVEDKQPILVGSNALHQDSTTRTLYRVCQGTAARKSAMSGSGSKSHLASQSLSYHNNQHSQLHGHQCKEAIAQVFKVLDAEVCHSCHLLRPFAPIELRSTHVS